MKATNVGNCSRKNTTSSCEQEQKGGCLGAGEPEYPGNLNPNGDICERRGPNADT
jgi:hypothetical protein